MKIYAAAVVKEPLSAIAAEYEKATGSKVTLAFDSASSTEQRFQADPDAALLVTKSTGALKDGITTPLGGTVAGVAVAPGSKEPDVSSKDKLKAALPAAKHIAVSDPARGAWTHFMKVIEGLGVKDDVLPKVTLAVNGLETLRFVVDGRADLGVSQSSEIVQASPDDFAGPFPKEFASAADFSLWHRTSLPPAAAGLIARLTGPAGREKRAADGILPPTAP